MGKQSRRKGKRTVAEMVHRRKKDARQGKELGIATPTGSGKLADVPMVERPIQGWLVEARAKGLVEPDVKVYRFGDLTVMTGTAPGRGRHLSISHPTRYPIWDEIAAARYRLLPDDCLMGVLLPSQAEYVNCHPNCFHLYEVVNLGDYLELWAGFQDAMEYIRRMAKRESPGGAVIETTELLAKGM